MLSISLAVLFVRLLPLLIPLGFLILLLALTVSGR